MLSLRGLILAVAIVTGTCLLAIAIGAVWLNTFIHSPAFKADVESRAADVLGGPVTIQSVNFDLFHGVKLQGAATQLGPGHDGGQGALTIQVASVNCAYAWTELFQRKLRLTGVTLDRPQIVLTKHASPTTKQAPSPQPEPSAGIINGPGGASVPFDFVLDRVEINKGSVSIRNAAGASLIELAGIDSVADTSGYLQGKDVTGHVQIASLNASGLQITDFTTPFSYSPSSLAATALTATAFGGRLSGDYDLGNASASVLNLNAKGLDVTQLTAGTTSSSSARLSGTLDFQSKWRGLETGDVNGEGDAQLANATLSGVKILQEASSLLKIKELNEPIISKGITHFVVQNRQTQFIGLQLDSSVCRITGDGTVGFDGPLHANLVLILSATAMHRLPKDAAASFVQQPDGSGSIAFQVSGTTSNPQTDLATRLLLQNTKIQKAIDKALDRFFR